MLIPITTSQGGEIAVWCATCHVLSSDAGTAHHDHVVLRCDACHNTSRIERLKPSEAAANLADMDMQAARHDDVIRRVEWGMVPGDWTVQVMVMWQALDSAHTPDVRLRRHSDTLDKWG